MVSPWSRFQNAVLTFPVYEEEFVIDPETGNPTRMSKPLQVLASLRPSNQSGLDVRELPGLNPSAIAMKGYAVEPKYLPGTIRQQDKAGIVITDAATGNQLTGEFIIDSLVQSRFGVVTQALGTKIEGYFQQTGG